MIALGVNAPISLWMFTGVILVLIFSLMVVWGVILTKQKCMTFFVWVFVGIIWSDICVGWSCIYKSRFYCDVYGVGVADIVEIVGHLYIISCIGFPRYICSWYPCTVLFIPHMASAWFDFFIFPSFLLVNVALLCPLTTLHPWVQQYNVGYIFES